MTNLPLNNLDFIFFLYSLYLPKKRKKVRGTISGDNSFRHN